MSDMIDPMTGDSSKPAQGNETDVTAVTSDTAGALLDRSGQQLLAQELVRQATDRGTDLVGPHGLLAELTKLVLETALEAEMAEHLGYEANDPAGRNGANSRNGRRSKTVLTGLGPVEVEVPRDREGTFEPVIVKKRQRRLNSIDQIVYPSPQRV